MIKLYKDLLIESTNFKSYYYRKYFERKIKNQFSKHIDAENEALSARIQKESEDMLAMLRRQTAINSAYEHSKLVIEDNTSINH